MIAKQRPVIERVRQSTNSVCQGFGKTSQRRNRSFDTYSIFSSAVGDEEFAFDNQLINTQVYRRVLNKAINAQFLQNADTGHKLEPFDEPLIDLSDEPLIDLSDEPKASSLPHRDHFGAGSPWFGSFDGAQPANGESALLGSGNDRAQEPTSLDDTSSTQRSEIGPMADRRSVKSRFAEPLTAENSPVQAYKAFDIRAVACRMQQETRQEQYYNEDNSGGEGDGSEADSEIVPNKKLALGVTDQEGDFTVFRHSPDARVSGSSNLSKATIATDDTHTSVPENTSIEYAYETAPSSSLIGPSTPLPLYTLAPSSFEKALERAFNPPIRKPSDDRVQADDDPYPLPPTINMQSVPLAGIKRSGSESHHFTLSALVWLVDPNFYTMDDSVVFNSIPGINIATVGNAWGLTSALKVYAA